MSSNEDSDDEAFESADEDISEDNCEQYGHQLSDNKSKNIFNKSNNIEININTNIPLNNFNEIEKNSVSKETEDNENKASNLSEEKNELSKEFDKSLKIVENLSLSNEKEIVSQTFVNELSVNTKKSIISDIESKSDKNEPIVENINENISTEQTVIKTRKLLRKFERVKTLEEERDVCDDKKTEVLNKLSNISVSNNVWNNWFNDIKSAAVSATSTTVSHASNWSLNPKNILTSAKTITTQVVDSMGSVVDSAIGAPPPEQMAVFHKQYEDNQQIENKTESNDQQNIDKASNLSQFGLGFVDYTLNALELIGKKTIGVIGEEKNKESKDYKKE